MARKIKSKLTSKFIKNFTKQKQPVVTPPDPVDHDSKEQAELHPFGYQAYEFEDFDQDAIIRYERLTNRGRDSIVPKAHDGEFTIDELKNRSYRRVILVRYTGEIREVYPDEYDTFSDSIPKGIYYVLDFTWDRESEGDLPVETLNRNTVENLLNALPIELRKNLRIYFKDFLNKSDTDKITEKLAVDPVTYTSPLKGEFNEYIEQTKPSRS